MTIFWTSYPGCHDFFSEVNQNNNDVLGKTHPEFLFCSFSLNLRHFSDILKMQFYFVPVLITTSLLVVLLQTFSYYCPTIWLYSSTATVYCRLATIGAGFLITVCNFFINDDFYKNNPGYPVSWPQAIRDSTKVETWQIGPCYMLFAMIFQSFATAFDFQILNRGR